MTEYINNCENNCENIFFNYKKIDIKVLETDLNFLEGHFITTGRIEFRLLPNQNYDH